MQKKNSLITAIVVIVLLTLLSSCCKHEWKAATCTEPQTCTKCRATQGEALGHKYGEEITLKEATCTENGVKEAVCIVCGDKKTTEIPAGHSWVFVGTERVATCSEAGQDKYICSICGETKFESLAKLKHQYKDGYCINCFSEDPSGVGFNPSDEEKEQIAKVKTIGDRQVERENDFYYLFFAFRDVDGNTVIAPCLLEMRIVNDNNETVYMAKKVVTTDDYSKWSNAFREWILASPKIMRSDIIKGSTSTGTLYFTVRLVDTYFKEYGLSISGLPVHSYRTVGVKEKATCASEGIMEYRCTDCGEIKYERINKLEHSFVEEVIAEGTCGKDGIVRKTCTVCGTVIEEKIPAAGKHTYRNSSVVVEPTCVSHGVLSITCSVCGMEGWTEELDKLEHSFVNDKCTSCGTLKIGSRGPAGGFVFYDCDLDNYDGNSDGLISSKCGWRFLEAAPEDIGKAVFGYYRHSANGKNLFVNGDTTYYEDSCTRKEIGCGKRNTEMLVNAMGSEAYVESSGSEKTDVYAAKMCANYSIGGYDDWFLPSKDELKQMNNLRGVDLENYPSGYLWSSSEDNNGGAWYLDLGFWVDCYNNYRGKICYVRPIRAFL